MHDWNCFWCCLFSILVGMHWISTQEGSFRKHQWIWERHTSEWWLWKKELKRNSVRQQHWWKFGVWHNRSVIGSERMTRQKCSNAVFVWLLAFGAMRFLSLLLQTVVVNCCAFANKCCNVLMEEWIGQTLCCGESVCYEITSPVHGSARLNTQFRG